MRNQRIMMAQKNEMNTTDPKNTERFLRLITPIQGRIFAYILSRWPNKTDAEDIMQDTITTIWNKFDNYQPGSDFQAWAITIAKYRLMSFQKKHIRKPIQFSEEALAALHNHSNQFLSKFDGRISALQGCVKKLNQPDKKMLDLKYLHEYPVKRIADRYAVTPRAIYKTLSRIHNILMRCIHRSMKEDAAYES